MARIDFRSPTLETLEERDRRITTDLEQARKFQQRILPVLDEFLGANRPDDDATLLAVENLL